MLVKFAQRNMSLRWESWMREIQCLVFQLTVPRISCWLRCTNSFSRGRDRIERSTKHLCCSAADYPCLLRKLHVIQRHVFSLLPQNTQFSCSLYIFHGGALPSLPHTSSWRGAHLIKRKDNCTFTLPYSFMLTVSYSFLPSDFESSGHNALFPQ